MADLPTGTVTFLFTDIEGSTKLLQRVGEERYGEIRADYERLLRQAWDEHHGVEVDTQGDAFFVVFPRATDALAAAAQA
jgi:class 3 adenylate cyclase